MMMMFVVTPSLDSIEHKFNSKSIKFPKLHKVPTLEAMNINKPWSEWKERLRNFGIKPPKRGIELGWVTRGTKLKKPSSSCGFARQARGAWGSWGLKTENQTFFFRASAQTHQPVRVGRARGYGGEGEGQGGERASLRGRAYVRADALVSVRTNQLVRTDTFFTVGVDGRNPSAG
jgi:hypothetical protein